MTIRDIMKKCDAELVTGEEFLDREIKAVCASDLLSDVLATDKHDFILVTGLCTPQVVRTAELMGSLGVMFVRKKYPPQEAIGMAKVHEVPLICTKHDLFETCCKLAGSGLEQY
jgi:hypothetical protein